MALGAMVLETIGLGAMALEALSWMAGFERQVLEVTLGDIALDAEALDARL